MSAPVGSRACRVMRAKLLAIGEMALPPSWRSRWKMQRIIATPPWANMRAIRAVYQKSRELTRRTGVKHTVGHIVPLNHPRVCGLHVEWNLIVEPASVNFSKGNAWCEWHGELFPPNEQLGLWYER